MYVEEFFELFLLELRQNAGLGIYYKFHRNDSSFIFRKAYFCQRLQYILDHVGSANQVIWDCGCGYGTTALFLAMNGYKVYGTTVEFYFEELENRKKYWAQHGDVSLFTYKYADLFTTGYHQEIDTIILQDTLHHVEPIEPALQILYKALKPLGKLVIVEENGANLIQTLKLTWQRGFKRTTLLQDEKLGKTILLGNENIRSFSAWKKLLVRNEFTINGDTLQHIRLLLPFLVKNKTQATIIATEQQLATSRFLKKNFFFGINFVATRNNGATSDEVSIKMRS